LTNRIPQNIFDTQIAASVCGYGEQISYESLVNKLLKIKLDKSEQYTDWAARPLSKKKIDYALADVTYLVDIYKLLINKIKELGRDDWADNEINYLKDSNNYYQDVNKSWLRVKFNSNSVKYQYIVMRLSSWRELKARELNLPRMHFLDDSNLLNLANFIESKKSNTYFAVKNIVEKNNVKFIDLGEELVTYDKVFRSSMFPKRFSHPNNKGYEVWSEIIIKYVTK
jgi:ribonuclease D